MLDTAISVDKFTVWYRRLTVLGAKCCHRKNTGIICKGELRKSSERTKLKYRLEISSESLAKRLYLRK